MVRCTKYRGLFPAIEQVAPRIQFKNEAITIERSPCHEHIHMRLRRLAADLQKGGQILRRLVQLSPQPQPSIGHDLHNSKKTKRRESALRVGTRVIENLVNMVRQCC